MGIVSEYMGNMLAKQVDDYCLVVWPITSQDMGITAFAIDPVTTTKIYAGTEGEVSFYDYQ